MNFNIFFAIRGRLYCTKLYIFVNDQPIYTSMNNISAPRHVITGGTISATYPDNARIIISDNAEVSFSALTIGSGCTFVLGQFCTVTINATATVGSNTQIILQPGSTLTVASGASLQLSTSCLLDVTLGKLILNGSTPLNLGSESILRIGNIPISGSGTISGPEFVENYVIQKFAFLEAKCTFVFDGVDIDGNWHMDRATGPIPNGSHLPDAMTGPCLSTMPLR